MRSFNGGSDAVANTSTRLIFGHTLGHKLMPTYARSAQTSSGANDFPGNQPTTRRCSGSSVSSMPDHPSFDRGLGVLEHLVECHLFARATWLWPVAPLEVVDEVVERPGGLAAPHCILLLGDARIFVEHGPGRIISDRIVPVLDDVVVCLVCE